MPARRGREGQTRVTAECSSDGINGREVPLCGHVLQREKSTKTKRQVVTGVITEDSAEFRDGVGIRGSDGHDGW